MQADGASAPPESRFGERLKYGRDQLDLSIEALSRLSKEYDPTGQGVSPTSIARYESGERLPGLGEFRMLCDALDVPARWLLYGDLDNAGKSTAEQALLASLETYMREKREDPIVGGMTVSQHVSWFARGNRAAAIAKAKKPKA